MLTRCKKYSDNTDEYEDDDDDCDYNNNPTISVMATLPDYRLSYNMVANSYFGHSTGTSANISLYRIHLLANDDIHCTSVMKMPHKCRQEAQLLQ